jgi:hypothetical protein
MSDYPATRINNDTNGNPRYVVHFPAFITEEDRNEINAEVERLQSLGQWAIPTSLLYVRALQRARRIGGRKFHNKQYGGGIVFQCYGQQEIDKIIEQGKAIPFPSWNTFGPGTGAFNQSHYSYSWRSDLGTFHVNPPQRRNGLWSLQFTNELGKVALPGLWNYLGKFSTANKAKKQAEKSYSEYASATK